MKSKTHWENVYKTKATTEVSWFQAHAERSLQLIHDAAVPRSAPIIDVGGGASTLVDDLLTEGYAQVTVLDLSGSALEKTKIRLGTRAAQVRWLEANVLQAELAARSYAVWHDRAVFHFLTVEADRQAYVRQLLHAVNPGGYVIVATFAEDGPSQCSGLPVMRYSAQELSDQLGAPFQLLDHQKEVHHTPGGNEQKFVYCLFRLAGL
ncbi:class I SAM-dependent methyltransferase [Salinisphaera hydrothermalis]|uniref:class I SAM-dependent methyltransferase n=1 Tax=Salinisphaera hydrothermalis TaxID=563188 RepID=UPI00334032A4